MFELDSIEFTKMMKTQLLLFIQTQKCTNECTEQEFIIEHNNHFHGILTTMLFIDELLSERHISINHEGVIDITEDGETYIKSVMDV